MVLLRKKIRIEIKDGPRDLNNSEIRLNTLISIN